MNAYLLLVIDVALSPPVVLGAGVFSEEKPTFSRTRRTTVIRTESGSNYNLASGKLRAAILNDETLAWVKPLLSERDRFPGLD